MFSTQSDNSSEFVYIFDIISLFAAEFEEPKIGVSGKGLKKVSAMDLINMFSLVLEEERCIKPPLMEQGYGLENRVE